MQALYAQQHLAKGARVRVRVRLYARRERGQCIECALQRARVMLTIGGHEVRLGGQSMSRPERLFAAHAQTDRRWARVEHRRVLPRLSANDHQVRQRRRCAGRLQPMGKMRPIEI